MATGLERFNGLIRCYREWAGDGNGTNTGLVGDGCVVEVGTGAGGVAAGVRVGRVTEPIGLNPPLLGGASAGTSCARPAGGVIGGCGIG